MKITNHLILNVRVDLQDDFIVTLMTGDHRILKTDTINPDTLPEYVDSAIENYEESDNEANDSEISDSNSVWKYELGDFDIEYTKLENGDYVLNAHSPIGANITSEPMQLDGIGYCVVSLVEMAIIVHFMPPDFDIKSLIDNADSFEDLFEDGEL